MSNGLINILFQISRWSILYRLKGTRKPGILELRDLWRVPAQESFMKNALPALLVVPLLSVPAFAASAGDKPMVTARNSGHLTLLALPQAAIKAHKEAISAISRWPKVGFKLATWFRPKTITSTPSITSDHCLNENEIRKSAAVSAENSNE